MAWVPQLCQILSLWCQGKFPRWPQEFSRDRPKQCHWDIGHGNSEVENMSTTSYLPPISALLVTGLNCICGEMETGLVEGLIFC